MSIISPICGTNRIGATTKAKQNAIQKRVDEINEMIKKANSLGLSVRDTSTTWQTEMKFKPLKYSRGVLFVTYEELDLYKYAKGGGRTWKKKTDRYGQYEISSVLSDIRKMYKSELKYY